MIYFSKNLFSTLSANVFYLFVGMFVGCVFLCCFILFYFLADIKFCAEPIIYHSYKCRCLFQVQRTRVCIDLLCVACL